MVHVSKQAKMWLWLLGAGVAGYFLGRKLEEKKLLAGK
jgi:hypothetical protein